MNAHIIEPAGAQPYEICGETESGFRFTVSSTLMDNMELVDALADTQSGDDVASAMGMSRLVMLVLGAAQRKALYDHLRTPAGNVQASAVMTEMIQIIASIGAPAKN